MNTKDFLAAILPPEGVYLIAVNTKNGFRHSGFSTFEEAAEAIAKCDKAGLTTYHACAAYKSKPYQNADGKVVARLAENWLSAKSFWCDIDCGEDKADTGKGYRTQREGAAALLSWCKQTGIPFPMLVNSGRGIHAYWILTEPLQPVEWVQAANSLKALMRSAGLLVDPSRTADFSSVLRPVGSHHRKDPTDPREVKVAMEQPAPIDTNEMLAKISDLVAESDEEIPPPPAWLVGEEVESIAHVPQMDSSAKACADHCAQMAAMRDTQGDVSYDHWRGVIGVISHCVEGIELAHEWSEKRGETGHANVDVDTRFNTWSSGPATCEFFNQCNPDGCDGCPHKGKIKSPIVLGRIIPEPTTEVVEDVVVEGQTTATSVEVPEFPAGYSWDGTCMVRAYPNKQGVLEAHAFTRTRLYPVGRIRNAEGEFEVVMRAHLPRGVVREFNLKVALIGAGGARLLENLGAYEVLTTNAKDAGIHMQAYIKDSVAKLTEEQAVCSTHSAFGWQDNGSFLLGRRLFNPDGTVVEALLNGYAADNQIVFPKAKGSVEGYTSQIDWIYNREGMEPMQYLMCSLWASPLVEFADPTYNGIPCALTGADSGKGKTTAAIAALYAFGQAFPGLCIAGKQGATVKAQAAFLGTLGNLPVVFDEITNIDSRALSNLCYALSNGVEAMRLKSSSGRVGFSQRESWRTHVAMTGNTCLTDRLSISGNAEAEAMRVFEIRVDSYDIPILDPIAVSTAVAQLERNQGCVGEEIIKYLVTHRDEATRILLETYQSLTTDKDLVSKPKYRFYRNHMACTLAMAKIMTNLGLIKFDLEKLKAFAVKAVRENFAGNEDLNAISTEEVLGRLIADLSPRIITTSVYDCRPGDAPAVVTCPQGVVGRAVRGTDMQKDDYDGRLWISARVAREWCVANRVDVNRLADNLRDDGVLLERRARITLGRGTTIVTAQQRCWELDLNKLSGDEE